MLNEPDDVTKISNRQLIGDSVRPGRCKQHRSDSGTLRSHDVPLWIVTHEKCLGWMDAEERQCPFEWRSVRLSPTDVHTKDGGIDPIEQAMTSKFLAPRTGRASPRCVGHDGGFDAGASQRLQDVHRMRIESGCPEDWLQEGGHESGAWDVSTKKELEALRKRTNSAIGLLLVEQQRTIESLASSGGIRRKTSTSAHSCRQRDYLLKPFSRERLGQALTRVRERQGAERPPAHVLRAAARPPGAPLERVVIRDGAQVHVVPVGKIDYVEAQDDYVGIRTGGKTLLKEQTLSDLEAQMDRRRFVRIHRSYLLNIERLARVELYAKDSRVAILSDGTKLPVSQIGISETPRASVGTTGASGTTGARGTGARANGAQVTRRLSTRSNLSDRLAPSREHLSYPTHPSSRRQAARALWTRPGLHDLLSY